MNEANETRDRRRFLATVAAAGAGSAVFSRALLAALGDAKKVTPEMVRQAEWVAGLSFTDAERDLMLADIEEAAGDYGALRAVALDNAVPPALAFSPAHAVSRAGAPLSGTNPASGPVEPAPAPHASSRRPAAEDDLAFSTLAELSRLVTSKAVSSAELTELYLERLRRFDGVLKCVVTLTEALAREQARAADRELAAGKRRGPLHGIPWGAKDLLAVPGYPTTWGSPIYKTTVRPEKATVAARLEAAGAVLVAKTSVGELAWGDVWFGGTTKNPWKTEQGSSGSSAGSASAVAAGLVGFAIGTETWGSVISPATRCGATGLRPTFGRVSRHGAMALSWSMDKIGVLARSAEDCALVFGAIHGADPNDPLAVDRPFAWPPERSVAKRRVGYVPALFEEDRAAKIKPDGKSEADLAAERTAARDWQKNDAAALDVLKRLGVTLVPIELPKKVPIGPLGLILTAEAATAFDDLVRSGRVKEMVRQVKDAWPNVFRQGQLVPAVEYIRANRIRTLLVRELEEVFKSVDLYVTPTFGGDNLLMTNLTGHPQVAVPNGCRSTDGTPTSLTFTGRLFGESDLLGLAHAYQEATGFHRKRPRLTA